MVQIFPMPLADFWSPLRVASLSLSLPAAAEISRTAGGEIIVAELGARLWSARVTLASTGIEDAAALQVKLRLLQRAGASIFVSPRIGDHPWRDPNGVIGASNVTIAALPAGNQTLSLAGLPPGYALSAGDYLAFSYGNPALQAFHQLVSPDDAPSLAKRKERRPIPAIYLPALAVDKTCQGQGVGAALLADARSSSGKLRRWFVMAIAFGHGWIDREQLKAQAEKFAKNEYGVYLSGLY
jgi:GNAT superfamily N-acetyltransferase